MQRIEYVDPNAHWVKGGGKVNEPVYSWVESSLGRGGIEDQIKKARRLLALMAADWLKLHPEMLGKAADEIDCEGMRHVLVSAATTERNEVKNGKQ